MTCFMKISFVWWVWQTKNMKVTLKSQHEIITAQKKKLELQGYLDFWFVVIKENV